MSGPAGQASLQNIKVGCPSLIQSNREGSVALKHPVPLEREIWRLATWQNLREARPGTNPTWLPIPVHGLPGFPTILCLLLPMVLRVLLPGCAGLWQSSLF